MKQKISENQLKFQSWLKQKAGNDYWHYPDAPDDFAIKLKQQYLELLAQQKLPLVHLIWHVTNKCNLLCQHCGVWGGEKKYQDLSKDQFFNKLPELLSLGLKALTLTGGEPFLRKDIFEIIKDARRTGLKVAAVTNGHYFERDREALQSCEIDSISISLDGLKNAHNQIRQSEKSFDKVIQAIEIANQIKIPIVNVNTCVYPENLHDLSEMRQIIFGAGANHWVLRPVAMSGRAGSYPLKISDSQIVELLDFASESIRSGYDVSVEGLGYLGSWDSILSLSPYFAYAGWNSFYILPDGSIKGFNDDSCPVEGNLLKDSLQELWHQKFTFYRSFEKPDICMDCAFWPKCVGGNHSEAETGWRCIRPILDTLDI